MRRLLHLLLLVASILQSVVVMGGVVPADHGQEQHCAGHETAQEDCPCCPDGAAAGVSCTVQCSVSQAPVALLVPVRISSYSTTTFDAQPTFAGVSHAPPVPPPIV